MRSWSFRAIVLLALLAPSVASARPSALLGKIDFPVTGPEEARRHFLRGMLAMHSFWYEEARDEFRAATAAAPGFAMGYWGEALTHYHPVWSQEDVAASRAVMAKIPADAKVSAREQGFLDAARVLFGDGDRHARWIGYTEALEAMQARTPRDDEVATLTAVAILGNGLADRYLDGREPGFRPFARAAALALEVLARNPDHPGAAHYVIHAFDDPEHAVLALPAARRYALIAPEASHARHMPSHIFVQLGMWPEATQSNEAAWAASEAWVRRKKIDVSYHDFHTLSWLQSVYLEQGQRAKALEVLGRARADLGATHEAVWVRLAYVRMVADYLTETDDWGRLEDLLAPVREPASAPAPSAKDGESGGATCHPLATRLASVARLEAATLSWIGGVAALAHGDPAAAEKAADALAVVAAAVDPEQRDLWRERELELRGRAAALRGDAKGAVATLESAIVLDERTPPTGPVQGVTARERLADLYLATDRPAESLAACRKVLDLHPRRGRALAGAVRAATAAKDPAAPALQSELDVVWAHADR